MKKAYFKKQLTAQVSNVVDKYIRNLALKKEVSLNIAINAMLDYAIAESTQTELDKYIQRNQDFKTGKLELEDDDE